MNAQDIAFLQVEFRKALAIADDAYTLSLELASILRAFNDSDDPRPWAFGLSGIADRVNLRVDEAATAARMVGLWLDRHAAGSSSWSAGSGCLCAKAHQGQGPGGPGGGTPPAEEAPRAGPEACPLRAAANYGQDDKQNATESSGLSSVIISA